MNSPIEVSSAEELRQAAGSAVSKQIIVRGKIVNAPSLCLPAGTELAGEGESPTIEFQPGADGVQLTSNNTVRNLSLLTSPGYRAIFNRQDLDNIGTMAIESVHCIGQVQIITEGITRTGHVSIGNLDIEFADATQRFPQP